MVEFKFATRHDTSSYAQLLRRKPRNKKRSHRQPAGERRRLQDPPIGASSAVDTSGSPRGPSSPPSPSHPAHYSVESTRLSRPQRATPCSPVASKRQHPQTQASPPRMSSNKRRKVDGARGGGQASWGDKEVPDTVKTRRCCLCGSTLSNWGYHQCRSCPTTCLCSYCIINAPMAHPFPDHSFRLVTADEHDEGGGDGSGDDTSGTIAASRSLAATGRSKHAARNKDPEEHSVVCKPMHRCGFCKQGLTGSYWKCQDCPDAFFCLDCSTLHYRPHELVRVEVDSAIRTRANCPGNHEPQSDDLALGLDASQDEDSGDGGFDAPDQDERGSDEDYDTGEDEDTEAGMDQGTAAGQNNASDTADEEFGQVTYPGSASLEGFLRRAMSKAVENAIQEVMVETKQFLQERPTSGSGSKGSQVPDRPRTLLDFDVDLVGPTNSYRPRQGPRVWGSGRSWLPEDRQQLEKLKSDGFSFNQIARKIERTVSAVKQQWMKQQVTKYYEGI